MKRIYKVIIVIVLIVISFGTINVLFGKTNNVSVENTKTNLFVGIKKENIMFDENPFIDSVFYGNVYNDEDNTSSIIDTYQLYENGIGLHDITIEIYDDLYYHEHGSYPSYVDTEIIGYVMLNERYYFNPNDKFFNVVGLNSLTFFGDNQFEYNFVLDKTTKVIDISFFTCNYIIGISYSYGDINAENTHEAYIKYNKQSNNELKISIYENYHRVFQAYYDSSYDLFFEDERYTDYVLIDMSYFTSRLCSNTNYLEWKKLKGNYIEINIVHGNNPLYDSLGYKLNKQGLYLFNLPHAYNLSITATWSDYYEKN